MNTLYCIECKKYLRTGNITNDIEHVNHLVEIVPVGEDAYYTIFMLQLKFCEELADLE